ncbi:MAG: hypothetical protein ABI866_09360 [Dokdonella sp.]
MRKAVFVASLFVVSQFVPGVSYASDFAGSGLGAIPDNNEAGLSINFNVSGITPTVGSVRLRLGVMHPWSGDLVATLRSPAGVSTLMILGRVGVGLGQADPTFGSATDFSGTYEFADDASLDLWSAAVANSGGAIPKGKYRTSGLGILNTRHGGCATSLAGAFNGLSGAQANGTWTLTVADRQNGITGSVTSALLSVSAAPDIFSAGFDPLVRGFCQKARMDYTGSGRTSYVTLRNTGGGPNGAMTWTIQDNNGTAAGAIQTFVLGVASDAFTDADYDGDGIADPIVWTQAPPSHFTIRRSSRSTDASVTVNFGQVGDVPNHAGDYDGDGRDDLALFRAGTNAGIASHTYIQLTGGPLRDLVTGENGAFASGGIDYTGDGKADMAIQANVDGVASFRIYDGTTGSIASTFTFGAPTDIIVLGNHVGNVLGDITTFSGVGGVLNWTTRDGQTGVGQPTVTLGISTTDFAISGDYDGDGLDDYAVWRPSSTAGLSKFIVRPSSNTGTTIEVPLGANGDYPIANGRTH